MSFARAAFGRGQRAPRDSGSNLRRDFWGKLRGALAHLPFAEELLAAYYCAFDRATPTQAKAALVAAIAYFVLPFDAIPDMLPIIGFTDDAAVLAATIKLVASHITPEHRQAAREKLQELNNQ
jgi:uncharacterized membrane protein YkvA (DUF1232 family)